MSFSNKQEARKALCELTSSTPTPAASIKVDEVIIQRSVLVGHGQIKIARFDGLEKWKDFVE